MRKFLGAVVLVACGDPRAEFVGSYSGIATRTVSTNSGDHVSSGPVSFTITAPASTDRFQFGSRCPFTGIPENGGTFQLDPIACPTVAGTSVSGISANYTDSYETGAGQLTNKTLTFMRSGTEVGSNYSNGDPNMTYGFTESVTVTRQ